MTDFSPIGRSVSEEAIEIRDRIFALADVKEAAMSEEDFLACADMIELAIRRAYANGYKGGRTEGLNTIKTTLEAQVKSLLSQLK